MGVTCTECLHLTINTSAGLYEGNKIMGNDLKASNEFIRAMVYVLGKYHFQRLVQIDVLKP